MKDSMTVPFDIQDCTFKPWKNNWKKKDKKFQAFIYCLWITNLANAIKTYFVFSKSHSKKIRLNFDEIYARKLTIS